MGPTSGTISLLYKHVEFCEDIKCKNLGKTGSGHPICGAFTCREDTREYNNFMAKNGLDPKKDPDKKYWESLNKNEI